MKRDPKSPWPGGYAQFRREITAEINAKFRALQIWDEICLSAVSRHGGDRGQKKERNQFQ
jgi:hypothetical protein